MVEKQKLYRIIIGAILLTFCIFSKDQFDFSGILFLIPYFIIGYDILKKGVLNSIKGKMLDENFLMAIATIGAFITGAYSEGVLVMLFYQIGEIFQDYAVLKSRKSIADLMNIRPDFAHLKIGNDIQTIDPKLVKIGDVILVKPGEKIPLDGIVIDGESILDMKALTGESIPKRVQKTEAVLSGCINLKGTLMIKVTKIFENSTASKILDLVENASSKKAKSEKFITKFAQYYTPIVVMFSLCIALFSPLLVPITYLDSIYRAMTFLVVSCPCALVISIPLGFFGGIGGASKKGILIKGSTALEMLSKVDTIVFDKTGTLTKGNFEVVKVHPERGSKEELLELATIAESYSDHPISLSLKRAYSASYDSTRLQNVWEESGKGIKALLDGQEILVGNEMLMKQNGIKVNPIETYQTIIYVAWNNKYFGYIEIADEIKEGTKETLTRLKRESHIKNMVMLTGDNQTVALKVAQTLAIEQVYAALLPDEKVKQMEKLLQARNKSGFIAFVGDGVNDAPVLAMADVGIAMGGLGVDAAIEAADIVLMDDNLSKLNDALLISKKTMKIVRENIIFSIGVKVLILGLGFFGHATMWEAVFADVGVSLIAIFNSMRALYIRKEII